MRERVLTPILDSEEAEPARVAAAALALLSSDESYLPSEWLLAASPETDAIKVDAVVRALSLIDLPVVAQRFVKELAHSHNPSVVAAMLRVLAAYRADPGESLVAFLKSGDPATAQAALAVAAAAGRTNCVTWCEWLMGSEVVATRNAAIEAGLQLGSRLAWSACVQRAQVGTADDAPCLLLCGLLGGLTEHHWLADKVRAGTDLPSTVWALGFAGRPQHLPCVLSLLDHPDERVSKLAAEAFTSVTGYRSSEGFPDANRAGGTVVSESGDGTLAFDDDDLDADLAPDAIDQLPTVDTASARAWWEEHGSRFTGTTRYLNGAALDLSSIHNALRHGPARRRPSWALAVAISSGGRYPIAVDAFGTRQLAQLHEFSHCDSSALHLLLR